MIFEHLKAKGLVEAVAPDLHRASRLMARAHKDLKTAQAMVGTDPEWAYLIAAHAILRAARALALAEGLRPRGREQARTLLQMAGCLVGEGEASMVNDLDQVRKKGQHFLEANAESRRALSRSRDHARLCQRASDAVIVRSPGQGVAGEDFEERG